MSSWHYPENVTLSFAYVLCTLPAHLGCSSRLKQKVIRNCIKRKPSVEETFITRQQYILSSFLKLDMKAFETWVEFAKLHSKNFPTNVVIVSLCISWGAKTFRSEACDAFSENLRWVQTGFKIIEIGTLLGSKNWTLDFASTHEGFIGSSQISPQ